MYRALKEQKREFAFASCDVIDGEGKIVECMMVHHDSAKMLVGSNSVGACFLYSRKVYETVGEYDPEMRLVEDFDYWQRICMKFPPACISTKLYAYRWHDGALTSTMKKDVFNRTLEQCLLKNRPGFGKLDALSLFYYYKGLYRCRENLGDTRNPYRRTYKMLNAYYFIAVRVPHKLKRMIKR